MKENDLWRCTVCGRFGTVGRCCGDETRERVNMEQLLAEHERLRAEVERLRVALEEIRNRSSIAVMRSDQSDQPELEVVLGDICLFVDAVLWKEYLLRDQEEDNEQ